ncbi:hypothetical protein [Victivallis vadensis]|uniref:hypothetical protein n=1 Tax=Victivallis vadensis TaxID=172901 RepID=UPI0023F7FA69|nr:hypothetical protein [Victivallis vadensis]
MTTPRGSLRNFLEESPFHEFLESCWNGSYYLNFPVSSGNPAYDPGGVCAHALYYLVYAEKLGLKQVRPGRAAQLAAWLATQVREDGYCLTDNGFTDHPAYASTLGDALGTSLCYASEIGLPEEERKQVLAALTRLAERHPRIRFPEGAQGKTQQLRFELRIYYWMALLSGDPVWKERFKLALDRGIYRYTHAAAVDGPLLQPSLNPDWTWNYVCGGGLTDRHATNTHTPAYYCTEPNGFMFVYLHALKHGVFERRDDFDWLCRNYIAGLPRNLSRAGNLSSDLDGYGIHRAWYGPVLVEGIPLEAAALAEVLGLPELAGYCRWYVDRYMEFVKRRPTYAGSGLPEAQPYGHKINIEAQFSQLASARFYGSIARALAEFGEVDAIAPVEPPAYGSFAWEAGWLRISTPEYETSFAGHTCLRNIPVVPCYGDPNLGTLIGGAPLATLFSKNELLYAASFPAASLWHIELDDHNGRRFLSCSTSPEDDTSVTVRRSPDGAMLDSTAFDPYDAPCNLFLKDGEFLELNWQRRDRANRFYFYVHNRYHADRIELDFGLKGMAGHYCDRVTFVLPIPDETAEFQDASGEFHPLAELSGLPEAIRWRRGNRTCLIDTLELTGASGGAKLAVAVRKLPADPGMPGGVNSFSPYSTSQVRFEVTPATDSRIWRLRCRLNFQ